MIGRLEGILLEKQPPEILLDVQGVGYELLLPMTSFYDFPETAQRVILYTHLVIREDAHLLFGFLKKQDRFLFRELIKTNGIGPKLALAILSAITAEEFYYAIEQEQLPRLVKIPGIGKKTAERLLVELKGKFTSSKQNILSTQAKINSDNDVINANWSGNLSPNEEAISALIALGYKPNEAEKMINKVFQPDLNSQQLIREALKSAF